MGLEPCARAAAAVRVRRCRDVRHTTVALVPASSSIRDMKVSTEKRPLESSASRTAHTLVIPFALAVLASRPGKLTITLGSARLANVSKSAAS